MITANTNYVLYEGSKQLFSALYVVVNYTYHASFQTYTCEIQPAVVSAVTTSYGSHSMQITKAQVDAKTGSGTNPSDKLSNQVEQVVADYLDAITENLSVTFTVV